jgi:hypothetical protein
MDVRTARIKDPAEELKWLERRKGGMGSSDSPVIYCGNVWKRFPVDVFLDKLEPAKLDDTENPNFRRGHTYEPLALALYAEQYGVEVYSPKTDAERFNDFQLFHPDLPVFTDLDASDSAKWIVEAKAPRQMMFDRVMAEGVADYNQIQGHHHAGVVDAVGYLPGYGKIGKGELKGVRFVIYAPETIEIFVWEMPFNPAMSQDVLQKSANFFQNHVLKKVPPVNPELGKIVKIKPAGGKFKHVDGDAWEQAAQEFLYAKEMHKAAEKRYKAAKAVLSDTMEAAKMDKIQLASGIKFSNGLRSGKTSFNIKAFRAAHPEINLQPFHKQGEPYRQLTPSGAMDNPFSEDWEAGKSNLAEQLRQYAGRDLDPELAMSVFSELQKRTEAHMMSLEVELDELGAAWAEAAKAVKVKTKKTV